MKLTPLIELTRGDTVECMHLGAVAVCNAQGRLLAHAGDAALTVFTRSTLKPFQALPLVEGGGIAHFGLLPQQVALLCASHNGDNEHVAQVTGMLAKAGLNQHALQCGCHLPLRYVYTPAPAPAGLRYDERNHNCSGKHAGFLAWCVQHGMPTDSYLAPGHPLQQAVRRDVARALRMNADQLIAGTDGCSAPNYAAPLSRLATGYARLASGAHDSELGTSLAALRDAMLSHPELVSGTGRNDLAFTRTGRGDWISKIGADGVQAVASISRAEAIAIKIIDGDKTALYAATVHAMDQLGWLDDTQRAELEPWRARAILSLRGDQVGERRAAFQLRR